MNSKTLLKSGIALAVLSSLSTHALADDHEATWKISGWINEGMTYYDDGEGSDLVQLSDNGTTLGSRITLSGGYKPNADDDLNFGFEVIVEPMSGAPNFAGGGSVTPLLFANQDNLDTFNGGDVGLLGSSLFIGGDWGKVTVGLQSMPTDNIAVLADPSGTIWSGISPLFRANGFTIRNLGAGATNTNWGSFAQCLGTPGLGIGIDCNGVYRNGIRYDAPAMGNFSVAVGYANDDIFDIALKYAGEVGGLKANFNLGYSNNADGGSNVGGTSADTLQFQVGLMDPDTGLFGTLAYQLEQAENAVAGSGDDTDASHVKFGIKKAFNSYGDSAFYVDYGSYNDQYGTAANVTGSELTVLGFGAEQYFGGRFLLYAKYEIISVDVDMTAGVENPYDSAEDLTLLQLGATIFF